MKTRGEQKQAFIKELARFLVEGQAMKSIHLSIGDKLALEWASLRAATPIIGYPTAEEAEKLLTEFLS